MTYVPVSESDFDLTRVPPHLLPTWAVVDERGRKVEAGKDLAALQTKLKDRTQQSVASATAKANRPGGAARVAQAGTDLERSGLTAWPAGDLPRVLDTKQSGGVIRAYPALVEEGSGPKATVAVRLLATERDRAVAMPAGVRRLVMLAVPSPVSYIQQHLTAQEKLALAASPYSSTQALFDDVLAAVVDAGIRAAHPDGLVFEQAAFERVRDAVSSTVVDTMFTAVSEVAAVLTAHRNAERAIKQANSMSLLGALTDLRQQMERLVFPGFVAVAGLDRLRRIRVYLQGVEARVQKLLQNPGRDAAWMREVTVATDRYTDAGGTFPPEVGAHPELVHARWMLEEFRLSLFAQELGTAETVSLQRITKALAAAR